MLKHFWNEAAANSFSSKHYIDSAFFYGQMLELTIKTYKATELLINASSKIACFKSFFWQTSYCSECHWSTIFIPEFAIFELHFIADIFPIKVCMAKAISIMIIFFLHKFQLVSISVETETPRMSFVFNFWLNRWMFSLKLFFLIFCSSFVTKFFQMKFQTQTHNTSFLKKWRKKNNSIQTAHTKRNQSQSIPVSIQYFYCTYECIVKIYVSNGKSNRISHKYSSQIRINRTKTIALSIYDFCRMNTFSHKQTYNINSFFFLNSLMKNKNHLKTNYACYYYKKIQTKIETFINMYVWTY